MKKHQRIQQAAVCLLFSLFAIASLPLKKKNANRSNGADQQEISESGSSGNTTGDLSQDVETTSRDATTGSKASFSDSDWEVVSSDDLGSELRGNLLIENRKSDGGKFIRVRYKVLNKTTGEELLLIPPSIIDARGRRYEELDWAAAYLPEGETTIVGEALPASLVKSFSAIFEVPQDADGLSFLARSFAPFRAEEKAIRLTPGAPYSIIGQTAATEGESARREAAISDDLEKLERRVLELAAAIGQEEYQRLLARAERQFEGFGDLLGEEMSETAKAREARVAMLNKLVSDMESRAKDRQAETSDKELRIAEARSQLAALNSRIDDERARYQAASNLINRLTNNKRTQIQRGSQAHYRYLQASRTMAQVQAGAPALKAEKARLEALIGELDPENED